MTQEASANERGPRELTLQLEPRAASHPQPLRSGEEMEGTRPERRQVPGVPQMLNEEHRPARDEDPPGFDKERLPRRPVPKFVSGENDDHRVDRAGLQRQRTDIGRRGSPLSMSLAPGA